MRWLLHNLVHGTASSQKKGPIAQCAIGPNDPGVSAIRRRLLSVSGGKSLAVRVASNEFDWDDRLRFDAISLKGPRPSSLVHN